MSQEETKSSESFDTKYFNHLENNVKDNFVLSPFSIITALSICGMGSDGNTLKEFCSLFGIKDLKTFYNSLMKLDKLYNNKNNTFTISTFNKVYSKINLEKEYKQLVADMADKLPESPEQVVKLVNNTINEKTHGKIPKLITTNDVSGAVLLILNTLYFSGEWETIFKDKDNREFYETYKRKKCIIKDCYFMYHRSIELEYANKYSNDILMLPYKDTDIKLVVIRRNDEKDWKFITPNILSGVKTEKTKICLRLPKFEISFERSCNEDLKTLGLKDAFSDKANFNKISKNGKLFISLVKHKAVIEVNEKGTVAAAATVVVMTRSINMAKHISFDHPFWFYLYDTKNKTVLFFGKCAKPSFSQKN